MSEDIKASIGKAIGTFLTIAIIATTLGLIAGVVTFAVKIVWGK